VSFVVKTARTYDPDPAHSEQVTNLALPCSMGFVNSMGTVHRRDVFWKSPPDCTISVGRALFQGSTTS